VQVWVGASTLIDQVYQVLPMRLAVREQVEDVLERQIRPPAEHLRRHMPDRSKSRLVMQRAGLVTQDTKSRHGGCCFQGTHHTRSSTK